MRLVCPNCGAQYEVDDRVVPDGGRDVQCSNCGHAWFQRPAGWEEDTQDNDPDLASRHEEIAPDDPVPEPAPDPEAEDDFEPPAAATPRRPLDEGVRGILTAEAERELQARAAEGNIETQPDLGIDEADPEEERRRVARERMAHMRGIEEGETLEPEVPPAPPEPEPEPPARRDLFPDIEEINSTLDSPPETTPEPVEREEHETNRPRRGGFRRGFSVIILLFALAFAVYYFAPQIVEAIPGVRPYMVQYVDFVNGLLAQIEGLMQLAIEKMEAAASGDGS